MCVVNGKMSLTRMETIKENAIQIKRRSLRFTDLELTKSLLVVTSIFIFFNLPNNLYRISIQFFNINAQVLN